MVEAAVEVLGTSADQAAATSRSLTLRAEVLRGSAECAAALETAAGLPARLWGSAAVMQGELQAYLPISPCISPYRPMRRGDAGRAAGVGRYGEI